MKMKRPLALLLCLGLLIPCLTALPARAADAPGTELYHADAPGSVDAGKELWPGNSTTAWHRTCELDTGETVEEFEYYNNRNADGGLPAGETLWFEIPDVRINTKPFAELELTMQYALVKANGDIDIGAVDQFQLYASTDGGATWSSSFAALREQVLLGYGKTSNGHDAIIYRVASGDLKPLVSDGAVINRIRVRPFGDHSTHYGAFRIHSVTVTGYTEKRADSGVALTRTGAGTTPVSEDVMRRMVVDRVYEIARKPWTTDTELITYNGGQEEARTQYYRAGFLYQGPTYTRSVRSTWEMFNNSIDLNGNYIGNTEPDLSVGMSCTPIATSGLTLISNARYYATEYVMTAEGVNLLGKLTNDTKSSNSGDVWSKYEPADLYDAYAELKPGDFVLVQNGVQQHDRVVTSPSKIVRFDSGNVNPFQSIAYLTETKGAIEYYWKDADGKLVTSTNKDPAAFQKEHPDYTYLYGSSLRVDKEYTFAKLYEEGYLPYTVEEFKNGAVNNAVVRVVTDSDESTLVSQGFSATVASNWQLNAITAGITDMTTGRLIWEDVDYRDLYTFQAIYKNEALNKALSSLPKGAYEFTLDVTAGPVTAIGGSRPVTRAVSIDFAVGGAAIPAAVPKLDTSGADGWAVNWLDKAFARGLLSEMNRTGFTKDVTRLQFADLAVQLAQVLTGKSVSPASASSFADTAEVSILRAKTAGISAGYKRDDGSYEFRPENPITRQEICVMLDHVMEYVAKNGGKKYLGTGDIAEKFIDRAEVADWAKAQVARMTLSGVMGGKATTGGDAIAPQANTTLQEAVTLAIKLDDMLK